MAHIDDGNGSDREVNVDLNLVPFIDLMSVCIIFLLITSVWTQISMIQLGSSIYAKRTNDLEVPPKDDNVSFNLRVTPNGYVISLNGAPVNIPKEKGQYNRSGLLTYLQQIKQRYRDKQDAIVFVDDVVAYEELIRSMDIMMISGFTNLSVGG